MSELIDYTGAENVAQIIVQSKLSKFIIYRSGASRMKSPIFECLETKTPESAKTLFLEWARITNNALPYDIVLTNIKGDLEDEEETTTKKKKAKTLRFAFILDPDESQAVAQPINNINNSEILELSLKVQRLEFEKLQLEQQKRDLEEELEEDEEETDHLSKIVGVLSPFLGGSMVTDPEKKATVNGIEEQTRLKKAINTLHRNDPEIISDLEKLAVISETQKPTFNMLLKSLRSM